MMDDLIIWLREQLDEDERAARGATQGPWGAGGKAIRGLRPWELAISKDYPLVEMAPTKRGGFDAQHIARWDPARVLAEVDAKRRIVAWLEHDAGFGLATTVTQAMSREEWNRVFTARQTIKLLALPYADRPGYRDEWKP